MSPDHFLFFIFLFFCYSFGIFSIGFVAGQQSVVERFKSTLKRKKTVDADHKRWLEEIERN